MRRTCSRVALAALAASALASGCRTTGAVPVEAAPARVNPRRSVVSVIINGQHPDYGSPWAKRKAWRNRVNGLVVEGNRILVHGRRLGDRTLVEIERSGESKRYRAKVEALDYEVPLGLLTVEDPEFWAGLEPLPIRDVVPTEGDVTLCRWLDSGQFEEARGVIKQLRVKDHFPGDVQLLTLDISSPITASGWGEIVLHDGEVVGITTSSGDDTLPALAAPVLKTFLAQARGGDYRGFARHGFYWQRLSNDALRAKLGLKDVDGGIRVRDVVPDSSADGALQAGDVVLEIGGARIDERGKFDHPEYGKLFFGALFTDGVTPGETLPAVVLRDGERQTVQLTLRAVTTQDEVVPRYGYDTAPDYLEVGGLVFQPLTLDYLRQWRSWWQNAPLRLLVAIDGAEKKAEAETKQLIVLNRVLPDPVNLGYHDLRALLVTKVNGQPATDMAALRAALEKPQDGFHIIEFAPGQAASRIVLDAEAAAAAEPGIRERYGLSGR